MKKLLPRPKLSYANVIATVALFLALTGGAYAANVLPRSSVGTSQIKDAAVTGAKIKPGTLQASNFAPGALPQGPQGVPGTPGAPGEPGDTGPRGARGAPGEIGDPGPRGAQGAPGRDGEDGTDGTDGKEGREGREGEAGARGERGARGPEGEPGEPGERGPRGERGPQGEPGEEGHQGEPGVTRTLTRWGEEVTSEKGPATSYAACRKNEVVTGGGFELLRLPKGRFPYQLQVDRPAIVRESSEEEVKEGEEEGEEVEGVSFPPPKDGASASGWAVTIQSIEGPVTFQAYVQCAVS